MSENLLKKYKNLPIPIKASLWFLICGFMSRGISVITTPIFTRILSTSEYGQYSVFNSWYGIISVFATMNLYSGVYAQGLIKFEEKQKEFSSSLQGLCLMLVVCWTAIYFAFRTFWNQLFSLTTVHMLALLVLCWTSAVFQFWSMEQRVNYKYRTLVILTIFVSISKPILGIVLILHAHDKVTARILGIVLVELIAYTGLFFIQMLQGKKFFAKDFWKYALRFNLPLIPHYLSMTVLNSADRIMISNIVGDGEAGIYNLAYSISQIMTIFNVALQQTIEPWLYKKIKKHSYNEIFNVSFSAIILIALVNILLIALAPEIITLFAPEAYFDAIYVIPPIAMSVYFMFLYSFFAVFEFYYEKTKYIMMATTLGAALNIVLNYIFINIYGYFAAGYTTLICYIVYALCHYLFMKRICKDKLNNVKPYNIKTLLITSLGFMTIGSTFMLTYDYTWLRYSLLTISFAILLVKHRKIKELLYKLMSIKK